MVLETYAIQGSDLRIGADILCRAALSDEFNDALGKYFDNDSNCFTSPYSDALNPKIQEEIVSVIESLLSKLIE